MKQITKIIYVAGVVDSLDRDEIMSRASESFPNKYGHHMTIQFGGVNTLPDYIGKEIVFRADMLYEDKDAVALSGYVVFFDNDVAEHIYDLMNEIDQIPHITLATAEGIKPVYSNELVRTNNYKFIVPIDVHLKIGAFCVFDDDTTGWVYEK